MEILEPQHERVQEGEIRLEEYDKKIRESKVKPPVEYPNDQVWTLSFDRSKSKKVSGVGVELVSPIRKTYLAAHRFQFLCTNKVVGYESVAIGLFLAMQEGSKILHVHGDLDVVVGKVRKQYTCQYT